MNRYQTPINQTLEQYVPLPLEQISQTADAIQGRYDQNQYAEAQANSALSNIRAVDPGQQQWVTKQAGQFKQDAHKLFDKYDGNYADPNYKREEQQLMLNYSGNPGYRTVQATNQYLDSQQKLRDKIIASGGDVDEVNQGKIFLDPSGNPIAPTQSIKPFTYMDDLKDSASKTKVEDHGDGTSSNMRTLGQLQQDVLNSGGTDDTFQQIVRHQRQLGVTDPAQLQANVSHIVNKILHPYSQINTDSSYGLARDKASGKLKAPSIEQMPTADYSNHGFVNATDYHPDKFGTPFWSTNKVAAYQFYGSTLPETRTMKAGEPVTGRNWTIGEHSGASLDSSTEPFTMGKDGGELMGQIGIGVIKGDPNSPIVALNKTNHNTDGVWGNSSSDEVKKVKGQYYINYGTKDQKEIEQVPVKVIRDNKTGTIHYVELNKPDAIKYFGDNLSHNDAPDYKDFYKDKPSELANTFNAVFGSEGPKNLAKYNQANSEDPDKKMMDKALENYFDHQPTDPRIYPKMQGLSLIDYIREQDHGNQSKQSNENISYGKGNTGISINQADAQSSTDGN